MHPTSSVPDGYDFLGHLYDAVIAPEGFQGFTEKLVEVLGLKAVTMIIRHSETHEVRALWLAGSITHEWTQAYALDYARDDVLAGHIMRAPMARFYASNLDLDIEHSPAFLETRFYREWLQPQNVAYAAGAIVLQEGGWVTQVILQRRPDQPAFSVQEMAFLDRLVPHLQRALQMRQRFDEARIDRARLAAGLDALSIPVFVFDERMLVRYCNRGAQRLLEQGDLQLLDDRLLTASSGKRRLGVEVSLAVAAHRSGDASGQVIITLPRERRAPLLLMLLPLKHDETTAHEGTALLFAFDPEVCKTQDTRLLQELFRLSPAEAQLSLALCQGKTLEAFARERGTSLHTVRSQLKSTYLKTGTHRQADLVAMLLSSPVFFLASYSHE